MSDDDIVAELDWWLSTVEERHGPNAIRTLLRRARDEVVALRDRIPPSREPYYRITQERMHEIRAEALEEAAMECEALGDKAREDTASQCAALIRALR